MALNKLTADALVDGTLDADAIGPASITTAKLHSNIISGQTAIGTVDASNDLLLIYDADATSLKKVPVSSVGATNTDSITEGSSNLYYTNARADARITNAIKDEDNMVSNSATHIPSQQSVKAYVDTEVAGLVSSAPGTLDTLNELAAALGDDASFSTTVTNSIATKLPLAGGTMTGNISLGDNVKANFGASADFEIYNSGYGSYIKYANATYPLRLQSDNFQIQSANGGTTKLVTTATGIDVNGLVVDGDATFTGASYNVVWDKSANALEFADDAELRFADNNDFIIRHTATHSQIRDVGTGKLKLSGSEIEINNENNTENMITAVVNAEVKLYHNGTEKLATTSTGIDVSGSIAVTDSVTVLIADGGADNEYAMQIKNQEATDDRSYGLLIHAGSTSTDRALVINDHDGTTPLFYVTGNGNVGIGTTNPDKTLTVNSGATNVAVSYTHLRAHET